MLSLPGMGLTEGEGESKGDGTEGEGEEGGAPRALIFKRQQKGGEGREKVWDSPIGDFFLNVNRYLEEFLALCTAQRTDFFKKRKYLG